jgi:anti-sigma factor RsiW
MQDLEFTISQYIDNSLPAVERAELETRLSADPATQVMLEEYRRLDRMMKSAMPIPAFPFDRLAHSISTAIDELQEERASRVYRIGAWIRGSAMPLALAASLMIVAGVGIELLNSHHAPTGWVRNGKTGAAPSMVVAINTVETTGPAVENVSIGPSTSSSASADQPVVVSFAPSQAPSPSHVMVVSGMTSGHDTVRSSATSFDME